VRELKNAMEFAVICAKGSSIHPEHLPAEILETRVGYDASQHEGDDRERIIKALDRASGNRTEAAQILGVSRATFYRRLAQLGLGDA
jgi:transcriptional regulator of acetoin/glycerol metabolism